jgi:predicted ester cyclase
VTGPFRIAEQESVLLDAVRRAVAALNQGDVDTYAAAFAPGCGRWMSGADEPLPAADVANTLRALHRAFTDFRLDEELLVASGSYVIARWRTRGRHTAEFAGLAPTGRSVDVRTCEIYQLEAGQVVATWSYGDPADMYHQLTAEEGPS